MLLLMHGPWLHIHGHWSVTKLLIYTAIIWSAYWEVPKQTANVYREHLNKLFAYIYAITSLRTEDEYSHSETVVRYNKKDGLHSALRIWKL